MTLGSSAARRITGKGVAALPRVDGSGRNCISRLFVNIREFFIQKLNKYQ
jgi:hypothetical protein